MYVACRLLSSSYHRHLIVLAAETAEQSCVHQHGHLMDWLQVEAMIRPNIDAMDLDHLQNWLADLKGQSSHCTREFEVARNWLKQVLPCCCLCMCVSSKRSMSHSCVACGMSRSLISSMLSVRTNTACLHHFAA